MNTYYRFIYFFMIGLAIWFIIDGDASKWPPEAIITCILLAFAGFTMALANFKRGNHDDV